MLMDTRNLSYLGLGLLVAIVGATIAGVPPEIWIPLALATIVIGAVLLVRLAQADGIDIAGRMVTHNEATASADALAPASLSEGTSVVDVQLIREADDVAGIPAVWLHRRGGRRVHRFVTDEGWTVQQVSTRDPDDPRKRVIGETLRFDTEAEATAAADKMARGIRASSESTTRSKRPTFAIEAPA